MLHSLNCLSPFHSFHSFICWREGKEKGGGEGEEESATVRWLLLTHSPSSADSLSLSLSFEGSRHCVYISHSFSTSFLCKWDSERGYLYWEYHTAQLCSCISHRHTLPALAHCPFRGVSFSLSALSAGISSTEENMHIISSTVTVPLCCACECTLLFSCSLLI